MAAELTGSFSTEFAAKKRWKIDAGLLAAIEGILPQAATVIDLGAGAGRYVEALRQRGHKAEGVDGIPEIHRLTDGLVKQVDLTEPFIWDKIYADRWRPYAALFVEVGEHVPAELADQLLNNVADAAESRLIVSWAVPGQRGRDHIHCQPPEWVACELGKRAWTFASSFTRDARKAAGKGWDKKLMVFVR